ncbi:MAG: hypothetical protein U9Q83_01205 [Bacteroidota bacterium]|nr:hypothetical protein [Bacteroidota bacterium]
MSNKKININNYEEFALDYLEGNLDNETLKVFVSFLEQNPEIKKEINEIAGFNFETESHSFDNKFLLKKSPVEGLSYFEYLVVSDIENTISDNEKDELELILTKQNKKFADYNLFSKTKLTNNDDIYKSKIELKNSPIEDLSYFEYLAISNLEGTITDKEKAELNSILKNDRQKTLDNKLFAKTILTPENIVFENKSSLKKSKIFTLKNIQLAVTSIAALFIVFIGIKFVFDNISEQKIKHIQQSYANIAIKSQNDIIAREVSKDTIIQNDVLIEHVFQIADNKEQNIDTLQSVFADIDDETLLNQKKLCFNCQDLPKIDNAIQKYSLINSGKYNLKDNINLSSIVNLAFKSFDAMTESNYNMKLAVDKSNKRVEFDIKEKSFAVAY